MQKINITFYARPVYGTDFCAVVMQDGEDKPFIFSSYDELLEWLTDEVKAVEWEEQWLEEWALEYAQKQWEGFIEDETERKLMRSEFQKGGVE